MRRKGDVFDAERRQRRRQRVDLVPGHATASENVNVDDTVAVYSVDSHQETLLTTLLPLPPCLSIVNSDEANQQKQPISLGIEEVSISNPMPM